MRATKAERSAELRQYRRDLGLCPGCGGDLPGGQKYCEGCRATATGYRRADRAKKGYSGKFQSGNRVRVPRWGGQDATGDKGVDAHLAATLARLPPPECVGVVQGNARSGASASSMPHSGVRAYAVAFPGFGVLMVRETEMIRVEKGG